MAIKFADVKVGEEITPLEKRGMTRAQILEYGYASGDENPIHMSDSAAWKTGLRGVIAHGLFFIAYMQQALTDWADDAEAIRDIDIKMIGSVRPGDNVLSTAKIANKYDSENIVDLVLAQFTFTPLIYARVVLIDPDISKEELKESLCTSKLEFKTSYEFEGRTITELNLEGELDAECIKEVIFLSIEEGAVKEWASKNEEVEIEILDEEDGQVEFILYRKRQSLAGKAKVKLK